MNYNFDYVRGAGESYGVMIDCVYGGTLAAGTMPAAS
jgi:hypothetical protein